MGFKNVIKRILAKLKFRQIADDVVIDYSANVKNSKFGGCNSVAPRCSIFNSEIGFGSYVGADSNIMGTKVGKYCSIGPDLRMPTGVHPTSTFVSTSPWFYSSSATNSRSYVDTQKFCEYKEAESGFWRVIGNDVWIGGGVTILEGVTIADGSVIAAGSVVTKDTPPYSISAGVPARVLKYRFPDDQIESLLGIRWWDRGEEWIRAHADLFENINVFLDAVSLEAGTLVDDDLNESGR